MGESALAVDVQKAKQALTQARRDVRAANIRDKRALDAVIAFKEAEGQKFYTFPEWVSIDAEQFAAASLAKAAVNARTAAEVNWRRAGIRSLRCQAIPEGYGTNPQDCACGACEPDTFTPVGANSTTVAHPIYVG